MREPLQCVRAQLGSLWPLRHHVRARISLCTLYVPIAGHHVTCQDSRVQDEVFLFFFPSFPESAHPRSVEPFLRASPLRAA